MSKREQQLRGFLFTIMILHWTIKYRVTPVMVTSHQHPVSHRHKHCPCHLRNQHQRQHLKIEMEEAMLAMNMTPTLPALLLYSSLDENCFQSYEEKSSVYKIEVLNEHKQDGERTYFLCYGYD